MLQARYLLASILTCACLPMSAQAAQSASLHVKFTPERLGHSTTVDFDVEIAALADRVPSPLTELDMHYPRELGLALSGLGLATCAQARLEALGPEACPANSRMGQGSALAEIPLGQEIIQETAAVAIVRAPEQEGRLALLFYANGEAPVNAQITFPGVLVPAPAPYDESIHINVPLVPSLPGAPDVAVVRMHATFGPRGLVYYEHVHGKLVAYRPEGILLPKRCPHGGFAFNAAFGFLDGSRATAQAAVPCPAHRPRRHPAG